MKFRQLMVIIVFLVTSIPSFGICPTTILRTFDKQRGFVDILAVKNQQTGMTQFRITTNPTTFLSHFKHGFPPDRAQARITLQAINTDDFKGVCVELGRINHDDPDFTMTFEVPTSELGRYELSFDCSIARGEDGVWVIGGEIFQASLQACRDSNEAMTEESPVWKELIWQNQERHKTIDIGRRSSHTEQQKKIEQAAPRNR